MQTLYEAAGGMDGMLRLAHAWHERVLADEVVSHAFSHGFHPRHTERLAQQAGAGACACANSKDSLRLRHSLLAATFIHRPIPGHSMNHRQSQR